MRRSTTSTATRKTRTTLVKSKRPTILSTAAQLFILIFAAIKQQINVPLIVLSFLGGAGFGSFYALKHTDVVCKVATFIKLDPGFLQ